jgi:hypothetical protein
MFIACSADGGVGLADEFADLYEEMRAVSPDGPREPLTPKAPGIPTQSPSKSRETSFSSVPASASVRSRPDSSCRPGSRRRHPGGSGSASTTGEIRRSGATRGCGRRQPIVHGRPRSADESFECLTKARKRSSHERD